MPLAPLGDGGKEEDLLLSFGSMETPDLANRRDPFDLANRVRTLETVLPILCAIAMWQFSILYLPIPAAMELIMVIPGWILGTGLAQGLLHVLPGTTRKPKPIH